LSATLIRFRSLLLACANRGGADEQNSACEHFEILACQQSGKSVATLWLKKKASNCVKLRADDDPAVVIDDQTIQGKAKVKTNSKHNPIELQSGTQHAMMKRKVITPNALQSVIADAVRDSNLSVALSW